MRLLVAADGSPHAKRAVEFAARFARELREAEVILVNVGHIPVLTFAAPNAMAYVDLTRFEEALEQTGQQILDDALKMFAGLNVSVSRLYRGGDPLREIIQAARDAAADVIILGARGLGQIGGLILGSVSERVLHAAHSPVLIVR
jgi:nucleotide-binding universal stress UspA family protein